MEWLKKALKRILFPPLLFIVIFSVPAFASMIYALSHNIGRPLAYISYIVSAYALIISVLGFPGIIRSIRQWVEHHPLMEKILSVPLGRRYMEDVHFRTKISLGAGFIINLLYIVIKMASGLYYRSLWFVYLAVYYTLLAVMRLLLLYRRKWPEGIARQKLELRHYRFCGVVLLLMNLALAGIVGFMVHQNRGYAYPGRLIYIMAAYSFYAVIMAIVSLIKFRRHGSPILSAAKAINLVAALVSILSLETAMLAQFGGDDDPAFRKTMTGATGGSVCVIVLGMAVYMIVKSTKSIKQLKS